MLKLLAGWQGYIVIIAVGALAFAGATGYAFLKGRSYERTAIYAKLAEDRITLLKDGKKVDEEVLAADDDDLICLLTECEPQ